MKKTKIGDLGFLLGHTLKAIKIEPESGGDVIDWSCYEAGCCTIPYILTVTCSEEDSLTLKNKYEEFKNEKN